MISKGLWQMQIPHFVPIWLIQRINHDGSSVDYLPTISKLFPGPPSTAHHCMAINGLFSRQIVQFSIVAKATHAA